VWAEVITYLDCLFSVESPTPRFL